MSKPSDLEGRIVLEADCHELALNQNVPLHRPHTFTAYDRLTNTNSKHVQVAMTGEHGLAWPWESLHIEALAWFDQWLKGQNTGILDGPHFRYVLPEAEGWRTSDVWPIPEAVHHTYAPRADERSVNTKGKPAPGCT